MLYSIMCISVCTSIQHWLKEQALIVTPKHWTLVGEWREIQKLSFMLEKAPTASMPMRTKGRGFLNWLDAIIEKLKTEKASEPLEHLHMMGCI